MIVVFVSSFDTMQRIWLVSISQRLFLSSAYNMPDSRAAVTLVRQLHQGHLLLLFHSALIISFANVTKLKCNMRHDISE